ncbi:MAG: complex I subunit 1/NuoH family protein, partial [Bryobacteraceae bacterium]
MDYYLITGVKAALLMGFLLLTLLYLQWIERKVIAHVQVRIGPSRVGPHGLLQPVADSLKLLLKEDLVPPHVNRFLYLLAPFLAVTLALLSYAVIPFGPEIEIFGVRTRLQLADLDIAVLFVLAVSSLFVYAIVLAGWASNSKYPLLGALRSAAQMISYELPLALAVAAPLLLANTLNLREIVERQEGYYLGFLPRWNVFQLPAPQLLGLVIFVVAMFAETNRVPFDLPEAENELVAGFHTEYSAMKFAAFFMAEYANMITVSAMATLLFLGGWLPPWP